MVQQHSKWYVLWLFIWTLQFLPEQNKAESWNGCYDFEYKAMNTADYCFKLTQPMTSWESFSYCNTISFRNLSSRQLTEIKEDLKNNEMWVKYESRDLYTNRSTLNDPHEMYILNTVRRCYGLNYQSRIVKHDCWNERLSQLCLRRKFFATAFNASAAEACDNARSIALPPFRGCFEARHACPNDTHNVRVRPLNANTSEDWQNIGIQVHWGSRMELRVLEFEDEDGRRFTKENYTKNNTVLLCRTGYPANTSIRLQLHKNMTAGGMTLWVSNAGRAQWPPTCEGGSLVGDKKNPHAVRVKSNGRYNNFPFTWCYVRDIFDGTLSTSNRVLEEGAELDNSCLNTRTSDDLRLEELLNENKLCARCLREALYQCVSTDECNRNCGVEGCKNFQERQQMVEQNFPKRIANWTDTSACGTQALWWLTEGDGDCNGDGIVDCDDNLARLLDPSCHPRSTDMRDLPVGKIYWNCLTNWTAEKTSEVSEEFSIKSPICLKPLAKESNDIPLYVEFLYSNETGYLNCNNHDFDAETALTELQRVVKDKKPFSLEVTERIASNISSLLKLNEDELRKAQNSSNVSSVPELIDGVLLLAPEGTNITRNNVVLSKFGGDIIGVKVLSAEPNGDTDFRRLGIQENITDYNELRNVGNKLEAAVVILQRPENTSIVTVISIEGADFISPKNAIPGSLGNLSTNNFSQIAPVSSEQFITEETNRTSSRLSGKPGDIGIQYGCINSFVVGVSLAKDGKYVPLRENSTVRVMFQTNITVLPGQTKQCVYWNPKDGNWKSDGCTLLPKENDSKLETCECNHLTYFAQIVTDGAIFTETEAKWLRLTSIICGSISLLGFAGVIGAGLFDKKWRRKPEIKVLLNLSAAVGASIGVFLWSALRLQPTRNTYCQVPGTECQVAGIFLHYFVLAGFCWMSVAAITHYLLLTSLEKRYRLHPEDDHFLCWALVAGWFVPLAPVSVLLIINANAYAGRSSDFCYPSGVAFYCAVLAPVCLLLLLNLFIFVAAIRFLYRKLYKSGGPSLTRRGVSEHKLRFRVALRCITLTFLFGLTWYFGLFSYHEIPAYIFCVTEALQGPLLFIFFVLGADTVKKRLKSFWRGIKRTETSSTLEIHNISPAETSVAWSSNDQTQKINDNSHKQISTQMSPSKVQTQPGFALLADCACDFRKINTTQLQTISKKGKTH